MQVASAEFTHLNLPVHTQDELAAWRTAMRGELLAMTREFALVQVASAHKAHEMWGDLAAKLGGGGGWNAPPHSSVSTSGHLLD